MFSPEIKSISVRCVLVEGGGGGVGGWGVKVKIGACGLKTKRLPFKVPLRDSLHPECAELSLCHGWLAVEALVDRS